MPTAASIFPPPFDGFPVEPVSAGVAMQFHVDRQVEQFEDSPICQRICHIEGAGMGEESLSVLVDLVYHRIHFHLPLVTTRPIQLSAGEHRNTWPETRPSQC